MEEMENREIIPIVGGVPEKPVGCSCARVAMRGRMGEYLELIVTHNVECTKAQQARAQQDGNM